MEYDFRVIERKWRENWTKTNAYEVSNNSTRPKCYVLDMFPYPSGAGLHVGHPLGYIASDIYARYKRSKGFNVLHPMGYDSFGLPAEQYALETGQHPAVTTENNIRTFRSQLEKIGFSFDWSREVRTSDPGYYKWTQWIFLKLFNSWYNRETNKAEPIETLIPRLKDFDKLSKKEQSDVLMNYRLAYSSFGEVNWCEALGTVLANDEVVNGVSERGGYPVVKKKLRQWYLRITEYAERLLEGLNRIEFSEAMKDMQTNWIGKSSGAEIDFEVKSEKLKVKNAEPINLKVYTTRPDTIFGVDFMVIAPEHELVEQITTADQQKAVDDYITYVKSRSERERMAEKKISGVFTGAYALNPFDNKEIPIWISEYVLAGYGTGAIMAVPCGDERDHKFATHFNIPITNIIGEYYNGHEANPTKEATLSNSGFLDGVKMTDAMEIVISELEKRNIGKRKINYKIRDAAFSRQRYWGEPFPIKWIDGVAVPLDEKELPLELPQVDSYSSGPDGEGPLANIPEWTQQHLETNTMPGYAGSSWYFLRYMDPHNNDAFCDRKASDYWNQVDLYIGGTEHAVGHLLYSRMWTKFLYDLGYISFDEPFKKLVNQGMIQGSSRFVYRVHGKNTFVSHGLKSNYSTDAIHVDVNIVDGVELDTGAFQKWRDEFNDAEFILEEGRYVTGTEVEKMSKSKYNTVNPDLLVERYGADTFRMYEMFLGPIEMSKPWDTKGIEGVHRFLKKLWRLFFDEEKGKVWNDDKPTDAELKVLHRTIKKIEEDNERFSFNTGVSTFMITVNDLTDLKCHKKAILSQLIILLNPYAPHITEELWHQLGFESSILDAPFPKLEEKYLIETSFNYPISVNGKKRAEINFDVNASKEEIEKTVLENPAIQKWLEGQSFEKLIYIPRKMINVVVKK
jgi:leucyl-tRNA synthetase